MKRLRTLYNHLHQVIKWKQPMHQKNISKISDSFCIYTIAIGLETLCSFIYKMFNFHAI